MIHRVWFFFVLLLSAFLMVSCGDPSSSLSDRELGRLQNLENTELRLNELKPIVGRYVGTPNDRKGLYLTREDRWVKSELNLTIHNVVHRDQKNVDDVTIPHLSGSLKWWIEGTDTYLEYQIKSGEYNPKTNKIYLVFENAASIEGTIRNNVLEAHWHSSTRGHNAGRLVLMR